MQRKIIHIDMDAFYASVEQRDNPELKGKPVAVGSGKERGVVSAASYEARKFGVRSAMSSILAKKKCPDLIFVQHHFDVYVEVSKQINEIFHDYTDLVEPLSLDEAFLDVTHNKKNMPSATLIAEEIRQRIKDETGLTASAGVSINKFLAKVASDYNKPDGVYVVTPEKAERFVEQLAIEKFFGVGKVMAKKMHQLGIYKGFDLKQRTLSELKRYFGKAGAYYYSIARAIDNRSVESNRERKSVGAELTFEKDLVTQFELGAHLYHVEQRLWERIEKAKFYGRTLTLKVKYADFNVITRSKTLPVRFSNFKLLHQTAKELLSSIDTSHEKIRLLGVSVSNLEDISQANGYQLTLDF